MPSSQGVDVDTSAPGPGPHDGERDATAQAAIRRAVEAAPDGIIVVDPDGAIVFANPMACEMFGYTADALVNAAVETLLPEDVRPGHVAHRTTYQAQPRSRPMGSGLDLRGRKQSGAEFPVEISLSSVEAAGTRFVVAIIRDVTERHKAAEELMAAHEQLALVGDRERIARDLHDTVIQRLFAVGLSLQSALMRASDAATAERIESAIDEIDGTIRDIRTAVFALHTRRTPTAGPRDDVLTTTREAARALGFEPSVHFEGLVDTGMPTAVHQQLLPTLRETLTNVAKHAQATRVSVALEVHDAVVLRVVDNGIGISDECTGGSGLRNIAERAEGLGGTCEVSPNDQGGTTIEWRVPLR